MIDKSPRRGKREVRGEQEGCSQVKTNQTNRNVHCGWSRRLKEARGGSRKESRRLYEWLRKPSRRLYKYYKRL
jgi:hypothetical protein